VGSADFMAGAVASVGFTVVAAAADLVGFTVAAVDLLGFTEGAVGGMAADFMGWLPTVASPTLGMGGVAMH